MINELLRDMTPVLELVHVTNLELRYPARRCLEGTDVS